MDGFPWNLILEPFMKTRPDTANLIKMRQNIGHFTSGCRHHKLAMKSVFAQSSVNLHCWQWYVSQQYAENALLRLVDSSSYANAAHYLFSWTLNLSLWNHYAVRNVARHLLFMQIINYALLWYFETSMASTALVNFATQCHHSRRSEAARHLLCKL
jgi:uncharacterized membrane protein (DUF106 family)